MLYQIDISRRAHQDIEDAACYIAYLPPRVGGEFFCSPLLQFNKVSLLVKHFFLHRRGFACAGADFVLSYA